MCLTLKLVMLPPWEVGEGCTLRMLGTRSAFLQFINLCTQQSAGHFSAYYSGEGVCTCSVLLDHPVHRNICLQSDPQKDLFTTVTFQGPQSHCPLSLLERKGHRFAWWMGFKIWGRRISCLFKYEMVPGFNLHRSTANLFLIGHLQRFLVVVAVAAVLFWF